MQGGRLSIMVLKSRPLSSGLDARWAPYITVLKLGRVWRLGKMGTPHYGVEIKATVNWAWCKWTPHIAILKSGWSATGLDGRWVPTIMVFKSRRLVTGHDMHNGHPPIRVLKSRQSSTGLDERWVPPMAVLKSRRSSTGHDARWVPPITGLISRWLATGHGGALGFWNQGSRPLGLMQDGRRSLRDWNQGGWWLGMMSTLHYDIEIKVGRQLGLMQDWAPHIT